MPELPEVECVRTVLRPHLVGQRITAVTITLPKVVANRSVAEFGALLTNQVIIDFTRRGKYLTFHLSGGGKVVLHLRMTGCLTIEPAQQEPLPHTHARFTLADGRELRYSDLRRFGKFWYFAPLEPDTSGQENLGPEPTAVTLGYLQQTIAKRHRALKTLLLDQTLIAGIGNIYSDEICFASKIHPEKPGAVLTNTELDALSQKIPEIIRFFTAHHQTNFREYHQKQGKSYQTDTYLQVYSHAGKPCPRCGQTLSGARLNGRSTVFCPQCQPAYTAKKST